MSNGVLVAPSPDQRIALAGDERDEAHAEDEQPARPAGVGGPERRVQARHINGAHQQERAQQQRPPDERVFRNLVSKQPGAGIAHVKDMPQLHKAKREK